MADLLAQKDTVTQFVCFITNLDFETFSPKWEHYAKGLRSKQAKPVLHRLMTETKNRFRYISQHEGIDSDFHFNFMKDRRAEHFPEHNVKVVHAGGYLSIQSADLALQSKKVKRNEPAELKLIAFLTHNDWDLDFYRQLSLYRSLNIHQAYYESCVYGHILEFYVPEINAEELMQVLKKRPGIEIGIYKEYPVINSKALHAPVK